MGQYFYPDLTLSFIYENKRFGEYIFSYNILSFLSLLESDHCPQRVLSLSPPLVTQTKWGFLFIIIYPRWGWWEDSAREAVCHSITT